MFIIFGFWQYWMNDDDHDDIYWVLLLSAVPAWLQEKVH